MFTTIPPSSEVTSAVPTVVDPPVQTEGGGPLPSKRIKDLRGRTFGWTTVIEFAGISKYKQALWKCKCKCGNEHITPGQPLSLGHTRSCGCYHKTQAKELSARKGPNLLGRVFGRLTVTEKTTKLVGIYNVTVWKCRCECGNLITTSTYSLIHGESTSCGCYHREVMRKIASARVGVLSPHWNPSLTDEDRYNRRFGSATGAAMNTVARQIRRRDDNTCLLCGSPGSIVHHLEPWAVDKDLRFDPANLVTLCTECHNQFHFLYGADGDIEDFEEYRKP